MNRLLLLIVVALFGLASMSGPTVAAGLASGDFWTVANQELCVEPASFVEKAPTFKRCSKEINGHAVVCQQMAAILPLPVECMFDQRSAALIQQDADVLPNPANGRRFRPPQAG